MLVSGASILGIEDKGQGAADLTPVCDELNPVAPQISHRPLSVVCSYTSSAALRFPASPFLLVLNLVLPLVSPAKAQKLQSQRVA